jgi:hypothetical protein
MGSRDLARLHKDRRDLGYHLRSVAVRIITWIQPRYAVSGDRKAGPTQVTKTNGAAMRTPVPMAAQRTRKQRSVADQTKVRAYLFNCPNRVTTHGPHQLVCQAFKGASRQALDACAAKPDSQAIESRAKSSMSPAYQPVAKYVAFHLHSTLMPQHY